MRPLTTDETKRLGKRIQAIRKAREMSQAQVSDKSGLSIDTLTRLETGKGQEPKLSTLIALAEALETSLNDLIPLGTDASPDADDLVAYIKHMDKDRRNALRLLLGLVE